MGDDIAATTYTREQRQAYRAKVRRCLDVFERMLVEHAFDFGQPTTGLEIELNLVDPEAEPAMRNAEILANLADPTFQTELGQFNLELNARPRLIEGNGFADYERDLRESLERADDRADKADARIILIGILPTLTTRHTVLENLHAAAPQLTDTEARSVLGSFLFSGDDAFKPAAVLSGGEKTRLALAILVVSSANVLLLDEPTNNLDPASREEVLAAIREYAGAIVLVTHDEGAVAALQPDRVLILPDGVEDLWSEEYADLISLA